MRASAENEGLFLVTVREAAERLACSPANVYALIESGELAVVPVGRRKGYRIDLRDLDTFVRERKFKFETPAPKAQPVRLKHLRL